MSTLKVNKIRDTAGSADSITLDPNGGAVIAGVTTVSTIKVGSGVTISSDGDIFHTGVCTATSFSGEIPAGSIVGVCTSGFTKTGGFGKLVQQVYYSFTGVHAITNSDYTQIPNWDASITPTSSSNKILVTTFLNWAGANNSYTIAARLYRKIGSGSYSHLSAADGLEGGGAGGSTNGVHLAAGEQTYDNYVRSFSTGIFEDTTHGQSGTAVSYSLYVHDPRDSGQVFINRYSYTTNSDYANYTLSGMLLQEIAP